MTSDRIAKIAIDDARRLRVQPATAEFPQIYREAMEIRWDAADRCLVSPVPREWSYSDWFRQILSAAREQGSALEIDSETRWQNIPLSLRRQLDCGSSVQVPDCGPDAAL